MTNVYILSPVEFTKYTMLDPKFPLTYISNKKQIFWLLHSTGWVTLALIYLFLYYRNILSEPVRVAAVLITYVVGFGITLLLRIFYRRIHDQSVSVLKLTLVIIGSSLVTAQLWFWVDFLVSIPLVGLEELSRQLPLQYYLSISLSRSFPMAIWSILYFMIKLWMDWNIQREQVARANALAQAAQLQMLRYQLNPHFLFNALNSIRALIEEDKNNAKDMITELSEFLRYSLISKNYADVPLKQEMEAVRHYFAIEKKRYEEKLEVSFEIEPLAEEFPVLSFLLHPLVENAVKYGMQTSTMPLRIIISAQVRDEQLDLRVLNSGRWIKADHKANMNNSTGTGLENIRQRLANAFPGHHNFTVVSENGLVGIRIVIRRRYVSNEVANIPGTDRR